MIKLRTKQGYTAYTCALIELFAIGGFGVCDSCSRITRTSGYLIPVLNRYYCQTCFEDWLNRAEYYPEDIPFERATAAYYESKIPVEGEIRFDNLYL